MKPRLTIMAKAPVLGRAKTRLAADIGKVHALRLYRAMMAKIIRTVQDPRWETVMAVTPPRAAGCVREWNGLVQTPQVSGSLSPRLADVFRYRGPQIVIGTDCPSVRTKDIADGFQALKHNRAVFGPADDGGFWLMGLKGPCKPDLFAHVRWSHEETLSDMQARINGDIACLRVLIDVDNFKALQAYRQMDRPVAFSHQR